MTQTTRDTTLPGGTDSAGGPSTRWAPVAVMALALLMVTLELSLSSVTLPAIGSELDVGTGATQWVLLAYALPTAALAIPAGRWTDRVDLRALFLFAVPAVGLSSVLAAVAPNFPLLVAARVLQGVASALVGALYLPVVAATVRPDQRGRAMGYIATIMPLGSMGGSSLGGLVADAYGWRPVMLMKIPVLIVVIWLGARFIPSTGRQGLTRPDRSLVGDGLVLGGALTAFLVGFDRIEAGQPVVAALFGAAGAALAACWTRMRSAAPVIGLLRRGPIGLPMLALLLTGTFVGLSYFLLPFYIADVLDRGAAMTGLAMVFFIGSVALCSPFSGRLADRLPGRYLGAGGLFLVIVGLLSMLTLGPGAGLLDIGWRLAVIGVGQALFGTPVNASILAATPPDMVGTSGGAGNTFRTLGFTLGPAIAALSYGLGGGGSSGFRTGVVVLALLQAAGVVALLASEGGQRSRAD
ncbi:MFS transporter [Streptomyces sp. NPDC059037]|uniref:MFS transporter n=1 Tax=Streptomyces sp. NPDC059037 TaxID=3346710 RepID=UPI00367811E1